MVTPELAGWVLLYVYIILVRACVPVCV